MCGAFALSVANRRMSFLDCHCVVCGRPRAAESGGFVVPLAESAKTTCCLRMRGYSAAGGILDLPCQRCLRVYLVRARVPPRRLFRRVTCAAARSSRHPDAASRRCATSRHHVAALRRGIRARDVLTRIGASCCVKRA